MTASATRQASRKHTTGLRGRSLSRLSFGGAPIGNLYESVDDEAAAATVMRAWNQGIRHFDSAPYYGYGLSESRLGVTLQQLERSSYTLSTKVGRRLEDELGRSDHADGFIVDNQRACFDYSRDGVMRSLESSLRRLRTDHVELLLLHDIGPLTHGANHPAVLRQALEEALPAMAELRSQGVCDAIGIGVNEEAICLEVMPRFPLDAIMLAGRYTLFEQQHSAQVMAQALLHDVAILAAGPYNSGLLGAAAAPGRFYDYAPADEVTLEKARQFYAICARSDTDVGAAALQFPLAHPAVASVVCGLRSVHEVDRAAERLRTAIPATTWSELRNAGLLLDNVPTP
ncbi:MAG: aldo/keto reductase [Rhodanobacter sp.]